MEGWVIKGIGGFYYVHTPNGLVECRARGILRKQGQTPLVGDRVELSGDGKGGWALARILPRKNQLIRPAVANLDQIVVVAAVCAPDPDLALLDKMLITAERYHISPILCLNKTDLQEGETLRRVYQGTGYPILEVSACTGAGIQELRDLLRDKVTAFAGNSGVGKSSLLNALFPSHSLETGEISRIERGRHTTRHTEVFALEEGGFVMDTPGFGSFAVPSMEPDELADCFPEFRSREGQCRFRGCSHVHEPDCAIRTALEQQQISQQRYEHYCFFYTTLKEQKKW